MNRAEVVQRGPEGAEIVAVAVPCGKSGAIELSADRSGMLARVAEAIAKANVNIEGYCEAQGVLHVLTKDPAATRRAVEVAGFKVRDERDIVIAAPRTARALQLGSSVKSRTPR